MSSYNIIDLQGQNIYSTAEAVKAANLDWEVDSGKLQLETFNREECKFIWNDLDSHKGVYRKDSGKALGQCVVGQGFTLVQNTEAFRCFDRILSTSQAEFVSGGYFHNGSSVFLQCKLPYKNVLPNGDTTERYLLIAQGHTGQQSLTARFTHIRPVCSNTLFAALRDSSHSFNIKHTSGWERKMGSAVTFMKQGLLHLSKAEEQFAKMTTIKLSEQEQLNFLKIAYERQVTEDLRDWRKWPKIEPIYSNARGKEFSEGTLWHPLNVVTEFEDHHSSVNNSRGNAGAYQSPEMLRQIRSVKSFFNNTVVNRKSKAFALATEVAAGRFDLKTGTPRVASRGYAAAALATGAVAVGTAASFI